MLPKQENKFIHTNIHGDKIEFLKVQDHPEVKAEAVSINLDTPTHEQIENLYEFLRSYYGD
jgi:hypothetical protein